MLTKGGRKIHHDYENPFDNVFIDIAHVMNKKMFRPLRLTPNMITTFSLLFGLASAIMFHHEYYASSAAFFITAYILDCADGNYARMYDMETVFGDYYDHFSDIFKVLALSVAIIVHRPLSVKIKTRFFLILAILVYLSSMHLGCQEHIYSPFSEKHFLGVFKSVCPNRKYIRWTRYFGVGTQMIFITLFILSIGPSGH